MTLTLGRGAVGETEMRTITQQGRENKIEKNRNKQLNIKSHHLMLQLYFSVFLIWI